MQAQPQKMVPNFTEHSDLPWLHSVPIPASSLQGCPAQHPSAKNRSGSLRYERFFLLQNWLSLASEEHACSLFIRYKSLLIKLKLFLGEIGTVSKLNYELPNRYIRLALEHVQSIDASWTGSPWTLRDWNSHLFHIQGLEGMNFRKFSSAGPNLEKYFIWDYSGNILSEDTS